MIAKCRHLTLTENRESFICNQGAKSSLISLSGETILSNCTSLQESANDPGRLLCVKECTNEVADDGLVCQEIEDIKRPRFVALFNDDGSMVYNQNEPVICDRFQEGYYDHLCENELGSNRIPFSNNFSADLVNLELSSVNPPEKRD